MNSDNNPKDTKEEHDSGPQPAQDHDADAGHTGEGAASAMAHMISRGEQQRHQAGNADDAPGGDRS